MTPLHRCRACILVLSLCVLASALHLRHVSQGRVLAAETIVATAPLATPDRVCAKCHEAIYDRYETTPMAQGSGLATEALDPGSFRHQPSAVDYRVFLRDGAAWMSYRRTEPSRDAQPTLEGERELQYFIGSGKHGRTYLYQQGSQWFELPINFYSRRQAWDMAPAFDLAASMPAVLPTDANCLHCHATDVQPSLASARNRFTSVPFRQGGIGCSACHGDPSEHLKQNGHGPILNPSKLAVAQRDSACLQCHLEGDAVVYRPGRSLAQFRVGEDLTDTAVYFVRASREAGEGRAASQYEALLQSACKRASGDSLTCTSCHDPHSSPDPATRVQYFRSRCLACHNSPQLAASHHPEQPDCALCHMPTRSTTDISHEQTTDHDIESRPTPHLSSSRLQSSSRAEQLIAVGTPHIGDREYGLAYAQLAIQGNEGAAQRALVLLRKAAASGASDSELQVRLGFLEQRSGQNELARSAYEAALKSDPYEPTALANLAVLDASSGKLAEAVHLLDRLATADPSQTSAGLNLAFIVCSLGHPAQAQRLALRLQTFNPDDPQLRSFLGSGNYAGQHCSVSAK